MMAPIAGHQKLQQRDREIMSSGDVKRRHKKEVVSQATPAG